MDTKLSSLLCRIIVAVALTIAITPINIKCRKMLNNDATSRVFLDEAPSYDNLLELANKSQVILNKRQSIKFVGHLNLKDASGRKFYFPIKCIKPESHAGADFNIVNGCDLRSMQSSGEYFLQSSAENNRLGLAFPNSRSKNCDCFAPDNLYSNKFSAYECSDPAFAEYKCRDCMTAYNATVESIHVAYYEFHDSSYYPNSETECRAKNKCAQLSQEPGYDDLQELLSRSEFNSGGARLIGHLEVFNTRANSTYLPIRFQKLDLEDECLSIDPKKGYLSEIFAGAFKVSFTSGGRRIECSTDSQIKSDESHNYYKCTDKREFLCRQDTTKSEAVAKLVVAYFEYHSSGTKKRPETCKHKPTNSCALLIEPPKYTPQSLKQLSCESKLVQWRKMAKFVGFVEIIDSSINNSAQIHSFLPINFHNIAMLSPTELSTAYSESRNASFLLEGDCTAIEFAAKEADEESEGDTELKVSEAFRLSFAYKQLLLTCSDSNYDTKKDFYEAYKCFSAHPRLLSCGEDLERRLKFNLHVAAIEFDANFDERANKTIVECQQLVK